MLNISENMLKDEDFANIGSEIAKLNNLKGLALVLTQNKIENNGLKKLVDGIA